jgi:hypothetical protein
MKAVITFAILTVSLRLVAQNGYVILNERDAPIIGYLKYFHAISDGQQGIEVWKTKKDKDPLQLKMSQIFEYAIKKDTFRILHNFKPFPRTSTYFDIVEGEIVARGKVNLLLIKNYQNPSRVSTYTGGGLIPAIIDESMANYSYMYVLEDPSGYLRAVSPKDEQFKDALLDFFPEGFISKYAAGNKRSDIRTFQISLGRTMQSEFSTS